MKQSGVERMGTMDQPEPSVFIIFGGAGDLTWRKLVPALFDLSQDRRVPPHLAIIVVDRAELSDTSLRRRCPCCRASFGAGPTCFSLLRIG